MCVSQRICLEIVLNSQIPKDFRLLTKQSLLRFPALNIEDFHCFLSCKSAPVLNACTYSGTQTCSQQTSYSFLKVAVRQKKKKYDIFNYKKWPHYSAAVITNDNILLSISIALSIHHGLVLQQQLSVHPCFFLLVFSSAGKYYAFNPDHFNCPLVS